MITRVRKAVGAIVAHNDDYLLVYKVKNMLAGPVRIAGVWDFPKGGVREGEAESVALLRELQEEIGSSAFRIVQRFAEKICFPFDQAVQQRIGYARQEITMFLVEYLGDRTDLLPHDEEIAQVSFFSTEEVLQRLAHEESRRFYKQFLSAYVHSRSIENTADAASLLIRLIATDLDGTLLRPDGTISSYTYTVLQRIQEAGIVVVLVSARPPRIVSEIARAAGVKGLAICCNGALVYDLDQECIVQHAPLESAIALRLIRVLREAMPDLCFACESGLTYRCDSAFQRLHSLKVPPGFSLTISDVLTFCDEPVTKLIVLHPTSSAEELAEATAHLMGEDVMVTHSGSRFLEISAAHVHKAWALANLCEQLGIMAAETMAFGDMPNDLSLLRWAGHGIAVANAHPLVLEGADEITLANFEDGVAYRLEQLLNRSSLANRRENMAL